MGEELFSDQPRCRRAPNDFEFDFLRHRSCLEGMGRGAVRRHARCRSGFVSLSVCQTNSFLVPRQSGPSAARHAVGAAFPGITGWKFWLHFFADTICVNCVIGLAETALPWRALRAQANVQREFARRLERVAKKQGANLAQWYGIIGAVPLSPISKIQIETAPDRWIDVDAVELARRAVRPDVEEERR